MNKLRVAEFFGGIGASSEALHKVYGKENIEIVDYVELDKHATNAYNAINGTNFQPRDINNVDVNSYGELDLLIAGWPCTSLSTAGKQKGMGEVVEKFYEYPTLSNIKTWYNKANEEGTYGEFISEYPSGLIYTTISKLMDMNTKPKRILLENVKGLLSAKFAKDLKLVQSLFEELGYKWQHVLLNSKHFDIPQSRERVFIMLTRNDLEEKDITSLADKKEITKVLRDVLDFTEPTFTIEIKTILESDYGKNVKNEYTNYIYLPPVNPERPLNNLEGRRLWKTDKFVGTIPAGSPPKIFFINNTSQYNGKIVRLELDKFNNQNREGINKVATLGTLSGVDFTEHTVNQVKSLTGVDGQYQTYTDNHGTGNNIIFKEHSFNQKKNYLGIDGITKTLRAGDCDAENKIIFKNIPFGQDKAFFGIEGQSQTLVTSSPDFKNKVLWDEENVIHYRKLSVKECWRLMGFSDEAFTKVNSLTDLTKSGKVKRVISDSQMCKQAGNSIVVNVLEAIFKLTF